MGNVIRPSAGPERIATDAEETRRAAQRQGGEIAAAAEQRLGALLPRYVGILDGYRQADAAYVKAWDDVLRVDGPSDLLVKAIRDAVFQAVGRVQGSPVMASTFPGGVAGYTDLDVFDQAARLEVLESRIAAIDHASVSQEQKDAWVGQLRGSREAYEAAVAPLRTARARRDVASLELRDAATALAVGLARLKRDLKNLGLTETQIHAVIPDDGARAKPREVPATPAEPVDVPA